MRLRAQFDKWWASLTPQEQHLFGHKDNALAAYLAGAKNRRKRAA